MKRSTTLSMLLLIAPLMAGSAMAQDDSYPAGQMRHSDATSFGYAAVLRVTPIFETVRTIQQERRCAADGYYRRAGRRDTTAGTVIGAIAGGALGNTVGKGDGRKAATVAGAVAGGVIGHQIARNNAAGDNGQLCRLVDVEHEEQRAAGFDVEYNYKGEIYVTRMPFNPGNRLRVRVTVVPDEHSAPPAGY